jgi:hypothetical protein
MSNVITSMDANHVAIKYEYGTEVLVVSGDRGWDSLTYDRHGDVVPAGTKIDMTEAEYMDVLAAMKSRDYKFRH